MLEVGDVDDLGHYVPRILELLTVDKEAWDTLRIGWIWRFSGIGRPDWRPAECEAVSDFFDALLRATLEDAVPVDPSQVIDEVGEFLDDLGRSIDIWDGDHREGSLCKLAEWPPDGRTYDHPQVSAWLARQETREALDKPSSTDRAPRLLRSSRWRRPAGARRRVAQAVKRRSLPV